MILAVLGVSRASDLDCRFNKINLRPDSTVPADFDFLPMLPADYPISGDKAGFLANSTFCPSVVQADDYECHGHDIGEIIANISDGAGSPPYPSSDSTPPLYWNTSFWTQLEDVIDHQIQRMSNESAPCSDTKHLNKLPSWWQDFSIKDCADAVHDEFPGIHHIELIKKLLGEGMQTDSSIIPDRCETPFLRGPVMLGDMNAWSVGVVGPLNFAAKYYVGFPRPEEVFWKIYTGKLNATHGVPPGIINKVSSFNVTAATNFTAYPEGSPQHPSWPAMHSAASSASLWLAVVGNLTAEQECEARKIDNAVASARTVAGVHYQWDNCGGLDMGQEFIARFLGDYLEEKYGADKAAVEAKIAQKRFRWCGNDPLANC